MKKNFLVFFITLTSIYSQEKTKVVYKNEDIIISANKLLEITSYVSESRTIPKSNQIKDYRVRIPFNSFNEISNIQGSTFITRLNKTKYLNSAAIVTFDTQDESVFKSDNKFKFFVLPEVEDNSKIEFSYKNTFKEPRFLNSFHFQSDLEIQSARFQIKCPPSVEIGYTLFGNFQDKVIFSKSKEGDLDVYTWQANDMEAFESQIDMPTPIYFVPHLVYYVKNYTINNTKKELLGSPELLYKWYVSLLKDCNKTDQTSLKNKTLELTKDKKTETEKAKAIFSWVQQNMNYVAFENGMGGFIPRDASAVYEKLYGDCKDMANLLNQMFLYANIDSHLAWIGTRLKPYTYQEVPTPQVDNHMITNAILEGKSYFFDATDKFCPFLYPSAMIQGKEALIGKSETGFEIEKIQEVPAAKNKTEILLELNLEDNNLTGNANVCLFGLAKTNLHHNLSNYNQKETEIWKSTIVENNNKLALEVIKLDKNSYEEAPSNAHFKVNYENILKEVNGKLLLKPILLTPFKETSIEIENRKLSIEKDFATAYEIQYNYNLPATFKVENLPDNYKTESDLGDLEIHYQLNQNVLTVLQKVSSKKLVLQPRDFERWNVFIKAVNKQYNQSIILSK